MHGDLSRPVRYLTTLAVALLCWFYSLAASADTTFPGDFFLFPDLKIDYISSGSRPGEDTTDYKPEIDLFYSYKKGSLLALVEYFLNNDENEFERLQIGWTDNKNTTVWLGRFHNPLGYWNLAQHHGIYLQTSISRPSIAEFPDDDGIMPLHVTGALFEFEAPLQGGANLFLDIALGASPTMENGKLEPVDIWRYGATKSHENLALRVRYIPDFTSDTQLGLFTGYTRMEGDSVRTDEIEQIQAGVFGVWDNNPFKLLGSVFFIDTTLTLPGRYRVAQSPTATLPAAIFRPSMPSTIALLYLDVSKTPPMSAVTLTWHYFRYLSITGKCLVCATTWYAIMRLPWKYEMTR